MSSPIDFYCSNTGCNYGSEEVEIVASNQLQLFPPENEPSHQSSFESFNHQDQKGLLEQQRQPMGDKSNYKEAREEPQVQKKDDQKQIQEKMDLYYRSNPLNVIHEKWEQESKTSLQCDVASQKRLQSVSALATHESKPTHRSQRSQKSDRENNRSRQGQQQSNLKANKTGDQSTVSQQQIDKKEKIEAIKSRIKQLFLNYCDFNVDNGNISISNSSFFKLLKDAKIMDEQVVNQNAVSILLSKECNANCNLIKNLSFEQFLNVVLKISEIKYAETFLKHPKKALSKILKEHVIPLLERIEMAVLRQKEDQFHSLYSVSELTLKLIIFNKDTQVIFQDILPIFKKIYESYFEQEISFQKGKYPDLMKVSLKSIMNFTRDFELCPYLIHQKACFLIWYSIAYTNNLQDLCNNENQKNILPPSINLGKSFTLGHFLVFIYRLSVIYFNHSNDNAAEYNLVKKLLYFLRKLENCEGFKKFMLKLSRTYNENLTFIPSKDLLYQIIKAERLDQKFINNEQEIDFISKEAMISRIVDQAHIEDEQDEVPDNVQIQEEVEIFLQDSEDEMKKLFQIYCSFGDPMNTKYLKSSKLVKLFRDCRLLKGQSSLPPQSGRRICQITLVDLDLAFKRVCVPRLTSPRKDQYSSQMSQLGASIDQSHQVSQNWQFNSQMTGRFNFQGINSTTNQNSNNKTFNFDQHSHMTDQFMNQLRLDFQQFKLLLEQISLKIVPDFPPSLAFVEVIKCFLIPHMKTMNDKRCVHNSKIQRLLSKLDSQEMIQVLTVLHKSIIDIYRSYADIKQHMNFQQFVNFCSDYDIFPYMISKPALYRIYHSLSFINEVLVSGNTGNLSTQKMFSPLRSNHQASKLSTMKSMIEGNVQKTGELIDEHLFVEALALCALYKGDTLESEVEEQKQERSAVDNSDDDVSEQTNIEIVLEFVEKMANSDGIYKRLKSQRDVSSTIKCNLLEKKDILEPFRNKFSWYFKQRYYKEDKKKNFQDVMEMSSVWTNSSQML